MDRFDITPALRNFALQNGRVWRKLSDGSLKACGRMRQGNLVALADGVFYKVADLTWALTYGMWPKFPLVTLAGDPGDLDNILPCRTFRMRFRVTKREGRFFHAYGQRPYISLEDCRLGYEDLLRRRLLPDLPHVLAIEAQEYALYHADRPKFVPPKFVPVVREQPKRKNAPRAKVAVPKTLRPREIAGRKWHWFQGQWVSVLPPVHVSDDFQVRCLAALKGYSYALEFNPQTQQTQLCAGQE